jgi:hypothetical protein
LSKLRKARALDLIIWIFEFNPSVTALVIGCRRYGRRVCRCVFNSLASFPAAPKLLRSNAANLAGCIVTADPLHCQKETAQLITQEKGGDYVLGVKDNQPAVRQNAEKKLAAAAPLLPRPTPGMVASKTAP